MKNNGASVRLAKKLEANFKCPYGKFRFEVQLRDKGMSRATSGISLAVGPRSRSEISSWIINILSIINI